MKKVGGVLKRRQKHGNQVTLRIDDLSGGVNYAVTPELLGEKEIQVANNRELNSGVQGGMTKTVDGIKAVFDTSVIVDTLCYYHDHMLFSVGKKLYVTDFTTKTLIGELTGAEAYSYCIYNDSVYIASGDELQVCTFKDDVFSLAVIPKSDVIDDLLSTPITYAEFDIPKADMLIERFGRLLAPKAGSDRIPYSGTSDPGNWFLDVEVESNAKYIDIGLEDGMNITAIVPFSGDLLVFKSNEDKTKSCVFRVIGEYPSWQVVELSRNVTCINSKCVVQSGNNLFFLDDSGFNSMATVVEYGEVKVFYAGAKIHKQIGNISTQFARLWYVKPKHQVWIKTSNNKQLFVFHVVTGAITVRKLKHNLNDVHVVGNNVYLAYGTKICKLDELCINDDDSVISSQLRTKNFTAKHLYLIKRITADFVSNSTGNGTINVGDITIPFSLSVSKTPLYGNHMPLYGNHTPIVPRVVSKISQRTNYTTDRFAVDLKMEGDVLVNGIQIDIAEV